MTTGEKNYEFINFDSLKESSGTYSYGDKKFQRPISYNIELWGSFPVIYEGPYTDAEAVARMPDVVNADF
jgi:hypothetical protein